MSTQSVQFEKLVQAPPSQAYTAFTNATTLRQWLCDVATVNPQPGGHVYLAWNSGYYACGEYITLEPDCKIAFSWNGRNEPGQTQVAITLSEKDGRTLVTLSHAVIGNGEVWKDSLRDINRGWITGLENLASVLESGEDLRITRRPMLGITANDFDAKIAGKLGIPVTEGIRIDKAIEGMSAQAAGLISDDVIVGMAGEEITGFQSLAKALEGNPSGDQIEVVYYRGNEKITTTMELSGRPIPKIPSTVKDLAETLQKQYSELEARLDNLFDGVSEAQASYKPAADEWSAKEVLAHLIQGERFVHLRIAELAGGQERWADDYTGNLEAWIRATISVYPTPHALLDELKRCYAETIALYANLREEFVQQKGSYWRLAFEALEGPYHFDSHNEQMIASIEAAKAK